MLATNSNGQFFMPSKHQKHTGTLTSLELFLIVRGIGLVPNVRLTFKTNFNINFNFRNISSLNTPSSRAKSGI